MQHPGFFDRAGPFSIAELALATGSELPPGADGAHLIEDVRPLNEAGPSHIAFLDNRKFLEQLSGTTAGACLVAPVFVDRVPAGTVALKTKVPYRGFAQLLQKFYPQAMQPLIARGGSATAIDPTAVLEDGAILEPGVVVGPEARIGAGTRIAAGAVIGARVCIGRNSYIGALVTVAHALVGDRVIIHTGVRIGQDGFGFAMGAGGHLKVPQIGRVIIQDDVEIGANSCIDRGALKDTIIGEGTKIDNLVQIGHNAIIGRHCVIVGQCGIAGSSELADYVVMGGQAGVVGHIKVGKGAQIAGASHAKDDVPAGARYVGTPAKPFTDFARELWAVERLAKREKAALSKSGGGDDGSGGA